MNVDIQLKKLLTNNENFACIFDTYLFDSQRVIDSKDLYEVDSKATKKTRDILKLWKTTDFKVYLAIENQTKEHLYMPLRNQGYDQELYMKQIQELRHDHKEKKDLTNKEYLSGIKQTDKLIPCITLTIYYGEERWKAPKKLKELLDDKLNLSKQEYSMHLIEIMDTTEDLYYKEEVQEIFYICKLFYQGKIQEIKTRYDRNMDKENAQLIASIVSNKQLLKILEKEESEVISMCKALDQYEAQLLQQGEARGEAMGTLNTLLTIAKEMLEKGFTDEMILSFNGITSNILNQAKQS